MKKLFIGILFSFMLISNAKAGFLTFAEANSANANAKKAIEESRTQYKIMAQNASVNQRRVAMQFARSFDDIDDETALKIMKLLKKKGDIND